MVKFFGLRIPNMVAVKLLMWRDRPGGLYPCGGSFSPRKVWRRSFFGTCKSLFLV